MVVGFNFKVTDKDNYLKKLAFDCSDRYSSSKLAYYKELLQKEESNDDVEGIIWMDHISSS